MTTTVQPAPALKDTLFSAERIRHFAKQLAAVSPKFDHKGFLHETLRRLEPLSLMERLRMITEQLHAALPLPYASAVAVLRKLAPRLESAFLAMVLSDFVAHYGAEHFDLSMDALQFFTRFGSSEFAVRHFLRRDLARALAVMTAWASSDDEHVRRLASEGSRPRLPWSFRLEPLLTDPSPVLPILETLRSDPSLYVRKSVANHLNDISKDHPAWLLAQLSTWPRDDVHTTWIIRHALRTLIKKGDRGALRMVGAVDDAQVELHTLRLTPRTLQLGDNVTLSFELVSTSAGPQKLVVDYAIHYVRPGRASRKVFKLKTLTLAAHERVTLSRKQSIRDFSTRKHHAGKHEVEVMVNGKVVGSASFTLRIV